MPNIVSSVKDLRRIKKRTVNNNRIRGRVKKTVKAFNEFVAQENIEKAKLYLPKAVKLLGKASQKKIIKKETASRKSSRLSKKLNKLITAANVKTAKKST